MLELFLGLTMFFYMILNLKVDLLLHLNVLLFPVPVQPVQMIALPSLTSSLSSGKTSTAFADSTLTVLLESHRGQHLIESFLLIPVTGSISRAHRPV